MKRRRPTMADVAKRVVAVQEACGHPTFAAQLDGAIGTRGVTAADIKGLALKILKAKGLNLAGVWLRFDWDPAHRRVTTYVKRKRRPKLPDRPARLRAVGPEELPRI